MIRKNTTMKMAIPIIMAVFILAGSAFAGTISIDPASGGFMGDELYTVQVTVDEVADLLGVSFVVAFDPAVVVPVEVTAGELLDDAPCTLFFQWVNAGDFLDTIEVDAALLGCTAAGSGALLNITFAGVGDGMSLLSFEQSELRDSDNFNIPVTTENGEVTYANEVTSYLSFQPETVLFEEDGTCEICLELEGVEDFLGMTVEFSFDPAVISPLGIVAGTALSGAGCPFFMDWVNSDDFLNTVQIDAALLGCTATIDGPFVCVAFQGVEFGDSPLTWMNVEVRDGNNDMILVNLVDGMVMYNSAVGVTKVSLDALKSRYK